MIERRLKARIVDALGDQAAVAIVGPRQVGKTTLAVEIAAATDSIYLDLENPDDREKLATPALFLAPYETKLVVLDEIHRMPELFQSLRGIIDRGRRRGARTGRFLILGSASVDLLRQSGESLAGRIAYVDMGPLDATEIPAEGDELRRLWLRGGYPDSYLANGYRQSFRRRRDLVRTYLDREVPMFGPRLPAETLERLWTMLAHGQGGLMNVSRLGAGLGISARTLNRYVDLLVDLLLVRRLRPFHANVGKRLVKTPKVYVRDSGIVHALLGLADFNALAGHPVVGPSWEGFVIENLLAVAPPLTQASFYRTAVGAEIDLLLELPGGERWAIEVKYGLVARPRRGFHHAREDLKPAHSFVVYSGTERYPRAEGVEAIGLRELCENLQNWGQS